MSHLVVALAVTCVALAVAVYLVAKHRAGPSTPLVATTLVPGAVAVPMALAGTGRAALIVAISAWTVTVVGVVVVVRIVCATRVKLAEIAAGKNRHDAADETP